MADFNVKIKIDASAIENMFEELIQDETTMKELHNEFAKRCDDYVPYLNGPLSESGLKNVTSEYVEWGGTEDVPYARYQYYGTDFNFTPDYHPKASAFWDKEMMNQEGDAFLEAVKKILVRRANELNGR